MLRKAGRQGPHRDTAAASLRSTGLGDAPQPRSVAQAATTLPLSWAAVVALVVGALVFAVPLERSSKLTRVEGKFVLRAYVEQFVSPLQTGALFFLLAFGAIARWRVGLVLEYRRLSTTPG